MHKNEFESSGLSPSNADFTIRDEGSILLLTPLTEPARTGFTKVLDVTTAISRFTRPL